MDEAAIREVTAQALELALVASAPALAAAVIVGLVVAVLGAVTQVQEQALSHVTKLVAVAMVLLASGAWMSEQIVGFTRELWQRIPELVP